MKYIRVYHVVFHCSYRCRRHVHFRVRLYSFMFVVQEYSTEHRRTTYSFSSLPLYLLDACTLSDYASAAALSDVVVPFRRDFMLSREVDRKAHTSSSFLFLVYFSIAFSSSHSLTILIHV